ncbi:LOW QUALITY PROTEIN: cell cycle control protein [Aspergillus luchuensis]|uniref:Cell cycle control protein n=1 Tax=Aspergillus kawachii TaxID=1069201 RepID=A0A146FNV1_ASPKA|nr:LOW QUALITY PROTEIN: cell cycle control protein [Aspergillus luchuensis]
MAVVDLSFGLKSYQLPTTEPSQPGSSIDIDRCSEHRHYTSTENLELNILQTDAKLLSVNTNPDSHGVAELHRLTEDM